LGDSYRAKKRRMKVAMQVISTNRPMIASTAAIPHRELRQPVILLPVTAKPIERAQRRQRGERLAVPA
jgi:hypothetical protein